MGARAGSNGHTVDVYYSTSDVWNARTAPKATTSTTTTTHNGGVRKAGLKAAQGQVVRGERKEPGQSWGADPCHHTAHRHYGGYRHRHHLYLRWRDIGHPWLFGTLYAKKADLKQLRAAARQAGITDEVDFREFGDWLEQDEKHGKGRGGKDHYSFNELIQLAKEWLELYK